ncbi:NAD(P)-binding protein [Wolfiporia cocos MD-104 SS10]|uniref:NAD(P)-binding protein n=1 Tax=Wolfiporia cocos (strain MD-104) TaxID=742152 RepID=A0A2H3J8L2_WOLCO|nr:NAD(P)-binding protein [Wolfiporia cocos MD-104 SS10]
MSNSKPLVLVTGVTGFLGSHIVKLLLEQGFRVRGTARSGKVSSAREAYTQYKESYEVVPIDDLAGGDYTAALQGVGAIIHQAAPLPDREASTEDALNVSVEGNLNILRQGDKAGITKFVFASSWNTLGAERGARPTRVLTDQDWGTITREEAIAAGNPWLTYQAEKLLSERAVWDYVDQHPHIDATTVNPPFLYGPFAPGYRIPEPKLGALGSNAFMYPLLIPSAKPLEWCSRGVDVRDVAQAMINALSVPSNVGRKRMLLTAEWFSWKDAVEYIAVERPALKDRLSVAARDAEPVDFTPFDPSRAKEVLKVEFRPWQVTVLDTVDALVAWENDWKSKGLKFDPPF